MCYAVRYHYIIYYRSLLGNERCKSEELKVIGGKSKTNSLTVKFTDKNCHRKFRWTDQKTYKLIRSFDFEDSGKYAITVVNAIGSAQDELDINVTGNDIFYTELTI